MEFSTDTAAAAAHFRRRLQVETDASDVFAGLEAVGGPAGDPGFVLVDARGLGVVDGSGAVELEIDPLTAPTAEGIRCAC